MLGDFKVAISCPLGLALQYGEAMADVSPLPSKL